MNKRMSTSSSRDKSLFVVIFPLKTEKWQEHRIDKILNMLTVLYNQKQSDLLARYKYLCHTPEFREAKKAGKFSLEKFWNSNGYTDRAMEKVFADSSLSGSVSKQQLLEHGINSYIIQDLSKHAFSAWDKKLSADGKGKRINNANKVNMFKSRVHYGKIMGFKYSTQDFTITLTADKPHKHDVFTIPFVVNPKSEYELFALKCEVREIAIVRKEIRGKYRYFVHFTFAGTPFNKGRKLGRGIVGIDPGPSKITYVSDKEVKKITLAEDIEMDEAATRKLQRKLDRSRRAMNPDKYNADGSINRENHEKWENSATYNRTRSKLSEIQRKLAAKRKIAHNKLANELLSQGNVFYVEKNNISGWATKAKETTKDDKGRFRSKKRYGKSVGNRAPSEFLTILQHKVEQYKEGEYVDISQFTACTQFDVSNGEFTEHPPRERTITTSDDNTHDRDALAAFNIKFTRREMVEGKKKIQKTIDNFDKERMKIFYPKFVRMEKKMKMSMCIK